MLCGLAMSADKKKGIFTKFGPDRFHLLLKMDAFYVGFCVGLLRLGLHLSASVHSDAQLIICLKFT